MIMRKKSLVGSLMHITSIRVEIMYTVGVIQISSLCKSHMVVAMGVGSKASRMDSGSVAKLFR